MHYIVMGILIGIGIMLAPIVIDLVVSLTLLLPLLLFAALVVAAVGAGIYGVWWVLSINAGDPAFWALLVFSALLIFVVFWPRTKGDGRNLIRTRGILAALLVILVSGLGLVIAATLIAVVVFENWRDPSFWLGFAVFIAISAFVVITARRGRSERKAESDLNNTTPERSAVQKSAAPE